MKASSSAASFRAGTGSIGGVHSLARAGLTQQPLELLDGQHGVVLRAVVEVVRHLGHVPRHGPAQGDPHRLAGRRQHRGGQPQRARRGQERHAERRGEHDFTQGGCAARTRLSGDGSVIHGKLDPVQDKIPADWCFSAAAVPSKRAGGWSCFLMHTSTSFSSSIPPSFLLPSTPASFLTSFSPSYHPSC